MRVVMMALPLLWGRSDRAAPLSLFWVLTDGPELLIFSTLRHFSTFCHLPSSAHHFYSCCRRNAPCLVLGGECAGPWPPASTGV